MPVGGKINVLVTGGFDYTGSVVSEKLIKDDHNIINMDDLVPGHRQAILPGAKLSSGDSGNPKDLKDVFGRFNIDAVMHMASETAVEYSMTDTRCLGVPVDLLASSDRARMDMGLAPKFYRIESIVRNLWDWMSNNPHGNTFTGRAKNG